MKTLLMTTVAALFAAGAAYAEDVKVLIDTDSDGRVTVEEWDAARADFAFGDWDADADTMLSREEYETAIQMQENADNFGGWDDNYAAWDADGDGMLSMEEYNSGLWDAFDEDDDSMWSQDETSAFEQNELNLDAVRSGAEASPPDGSSAGGSSN
jgi:hypothetical protein